MRKEIYKNTNISYSLSAHTPRPSKSQNEIDRKGIFCTVVF